ncbi:alpha/beta hydrolase [Thermotoga neapolitana]|uniref:Esterase n=1 Tax=Thermotoga neapolitana (strain ATCC 49049 / DSM 4359 / NBRC 107923 / NS-E) TaxID=309803 RepID=B9K9F8_THENN|nr:alpha/beta hydrolase [Thermotoga neapolitana]ACM23591.1 Esterase [Thermotoga neapolitana DSM 4359]HBF11331.1 alpha/beta hydrolase [Thermotoga neapolitana]
MIKLMIKTVLLIFSFVALFSNALLGLFFFFLLSLPLVRNALLGRLPVKLKKSVTGRVYTYEYKEGLKMDIYYPSVKRKSYPFVLFAHGGGWISGYRRQPNNISWYRFLNANGFAVATFDYRYGYFHFIEDILEDLKSAISFLNENKEYLMMKTLNLMGLSAGGHLVLYHAMRVSKEGKKDFDGHVVAWYAPCDLLDLWSLETTSLFARFSVATTLKGLPLRKREDYEFYSPVHWVTPKAPPTMLVHGMKDEVVPYVSSVKMYKKLRENGVTTKLRLHPKGKHGFEFVLKDSLTVKFLYETVSFLKR